MLLALWLNSRIRNARAAPPRPRPGRPPRAYYRLGRWRWPALAGCGLLALVALVLLVAVLVYWSTKGISAGSTTMEFAAGLAANSLMTGVGAAIFGALAALVLAVLAGGSPRPSRARWSGSDTPASHASGIVVALALVFFATRAAPALYQTLTMLIFALTVHYLPLAIGPIGASLAQVSPRVEEAARGLGRGPIEVFRSITVPLVRGGILAGAALVFLHAVKELRLR